MSNLKRWRPKIFTRHFMLPTYPSILSLRKHSSWDGSLFAKIIGELCTIIYWNNYSSEHRVSLKLARLQGLKELSCMQSKTKKKATSKVVHLQLVFTVTRMGSASAAVPINQIAKTKWKCEQYLENKSFLNTVRTFQEGGHFFIRLNVDRVRSSCLLFFQKYKKIRWLWNHPLATL